MKLTRLALGALAITASSTLAHDSQNLGSEPLADELLIANSHVDPIEPENVRAVHSVHEIDLNSSAHFPLNVGENMNCFNWRPGDGIAGVNGSVYAMVVWDDGSGPALYVGGMFSVAGDVLASNIAKWDGAGWTAVGGGTSSAVLALCVHGDDLIAGGWFNAAGSVSANHIARWDGMEWSPLDSGTDDVVRVLTEFNGSLIAGGDFTNAGGVAANYIAHWDGNSWLPLGAGLQNGSVLALHIYNNQLVAGGGFVGSLARWNGSSWLPLGNGPSMLVVNVLTTYDGDLIAGGAFSASNVKRWNGVSWSPMGNGPISGVDALRVWNGELIITGNFGFSMGYNRVAQWNGTSWDFLSWSQGLTGGGRYRSLCIYDEQLFVGGDFATLNGVRSNFVASWNGTTWSPAGSWTGLNDTVESMAFFDGQLIVAGQFSSAGGNPASRIAAWDGEQWSALASSPGYVANALTVFDNSLIAAGTAGRVAEWNGTSWAQLGLGSNGLLGAVALTTHNGDLIAGGSFLTSGGMSINQIALWNGTGWEELGGGTNGGVLALVNYGGELIVGGAFTEAGGVPAELVARWDGESWQPMGTGLAGAFAGGHVEALVVYGEMLIAGGTFNTQSGAVANFIAQWDGVEWSPLPSSPVTSQVKELTVYNGELVVGGWAITRWDGVNWFPMGTGIYGGTVTSFAVFGEELIIGGDFEYAGASAYIARWGPTYGDLDHDNHIGPGDVFLFNECFSGPMVLPGLGCDCADANSDGDVDLGDFSYFQLHFTASE